MNLYTNYYSTDVAFVLISNLYISFVCFLKLK